MLTQEQKDTTQIIILAAGKGTRMHSDIPKVLMPLGDTTMVQYLLNHGVKDLGLSKKTIVVVGYEKDQIKSVLGNGYLYADQDEQLGTGHAVHMATPSLDPETKTVVVLYGDMPYIPKETLEKLISVQSLSQNPITMLTSRVEPNWDDWRAGFYNWGRIIRNNDNEIEQIIEKKDASESQREITEVTSAHFAFNRTWLEHALPMLTNTNASSEYYLTDLPKMAFAQGHKIHSVDANPREVIGANTLDELDTIKELL